MKNRTTAVLLALLMALPGTATAERFTGSPAPIQSARVVYAEPSDSVIQNAMASEVVRQVNAERMQYGMSSLRVDEELTAAARVRAWEIVEKLSHTRPDGSKWSTVSPLAFGENIARGYKTADRVMAAWLTSDGHRANILRESYGSIGVCAIQVNGVMYWVQLFGR